VENGCSELIGADRGCMKLNGAELAPPVQPRRTYKYIGSLAKPESQQRSNSIKQLQPPVFQCAVFLTYPTIFEIRAHSVPKRPLCRLSDSCQTRDNMIPPLTLYHTPIGSGLCRCRPRLSASYCATSSASCHVTECN